MRNDQTVPPRAIGTFSGKASQIELANSIGNCLLPLPIPEGAIGYSKPTATNNNDPRIVKNRG
ncbi:hypothetical protein IQ270_10385 [Microcoleus sp. LEGE 07076]|uniref:hypothetical protein n=1 Tax=Microcoleus sp. LEGE 07076 TaxID=915322 RepID=UPI001880AC65|nr:hypothetical protein [Microcoleus sp. LEGE 07076]MBE9185112.1 hypothetical protein [Microcoleus sp. LEGE 07076]